MTSAASWEARVAYPDAGAFAYVPGRVLVRVEPGPDLDRAVAVITAVTAGTPDPQAGDVAGYVLIFVGDDVQIPHLVEELRAEGFDAQPDHVLFADPGQRREEELSANPFSGNPFSGNPFSGNPFSGNPFSGNPGLGYPYPKPPFAGPRGRAYARTGRGRNTARPASSPWQVVNAAAGAAPAAVTLLDVALPSRRLPSVLANCVPPAVTAGPDEDRDGFLDRVAGHGMFGAGIVAQADPYSVIDVVPVLTNLGDAEESDVARIVAGLAGRTSILNMSFSGYAMHRMGCLARAVRRFQFLPLGYPNPPRPASGRDGGVVVASAGNDGTWWAPYPAVLPGVIGVGALGPDGPAPFTNWGSWVRACAAGVDVRSAYFLPESWTVIENGVAVPKWGQEPPGPEGDPDLFEGAASWDGTSFSAPLVAGRLARLVREEGILPKEAVRRLIDAPDLARLPWLGTIVTA